MSTFRSTVCLLKLKELFLLKTFTPKYIHKPRYMEVKIPARIVKLGLVSPKLADFVAIGPKFKTKTFLKHVQLYMYMYHSRILLEYVTKIEADHKARRSKAKSCSNIKTCYRQKVFNQTTMVRFVPRGVCIFTRREYKLE
jgi:hypothetical protein